MLRGTRKLPAFVLRLLACVVHCPAHPLVYSIASIDKFIAKRAFNTYICPLLSIVFQVMTALIHVDYTVLAEPLEALLLSRGDFRELDRYNPRSPPKYWDCAAPIPPPGGVR